MNMKAGYRSKKRMTLNNMNSQKTKKITSCRVCSEQKLKPILALGNQYVINFLDSETTSEHLSAPLDLVLCENNECRLLQLNHSVEPDYMYRTYWYKSGINQTMRDALADITKSAKERVELVEGDIVVDIGANDGTLLRTYKEKKIKKIGFEPAINLISDAEQGGNKIINNYFNAADFQELNLGKKAKIITSIAMFYDLEHPNEFVKDISQIIDEDGIWINQMNYLGTMLEFNAFDNISHEHLEYYSLSSLNFLLNRHGLEVFDVELNDLNGGSLRAYIGKKGNFDVKESVSKLLKKEGDLNRTKTYQDFASRLEKIKSEINALIEKAISNGQSVYVYGASTRGNTLLQYFGLDKAKITAAAERNPNKWGKIMVGTNIPIISEEEARNQNPDYFLVLPWAFKEEFVEREREFIQNGGKLIFPLPELSVVQQ